MHFLFREDCAEYLLTLKAAVVARMGRLGEVFFLLALLGTLLTTLAFEDKGEEVEVLADDDWTEGWAAISFTFLVVVSGYIVGNLCKMSPIFLYMNISNISCTLGSRKESQHFEKYKHRAIQTPLTWRGQNLILPQHFTILFFPSLSRDTHCMRLPRRSF